MPRLSFISDANLENAVKNVVSSVLRKYNDVDNSFSQNVVDPFSVFFETVCFQLDEAAWEKNEKIRQIQKVVTNSIGTFHQKILGSIEGWEEIQKGGIIDIVNNDFKIIAEIKNKHNTLNASGHKSLYEVLHQQVMQKGQLYKDYTAYLVEIVPSSCLRYNCTYTPSNKSTGSRFPENHLIRKIDGYSFYALASGDADALDKLFAVLPSVISDLYPDLFVNSTFVKNFFDNCYHN